LLLAPTATATLPENRNWFVRHKVLTGLLGVFALFMLMVILTSNGSSRTTVQSVASPVSASQTAAATPTPGADKAAADKAAADNAAADKAAADKAAADKAAADKAAAGTVSQQNAVRSASDYLKFQAFSRSGLIHQLEFEGFSTADATYGVDKLNVDWNEQAAKSAADYLKFSSFSHSSLVAQLKFEGFTAQQAEYGVKQTGL
jgi:hypothetical protein